MRIIGGKFGGRRFNPPADKWPTRPTTDYAKEGLFNILTNNFDFSEVKMLDLFGGTGSHSYEFISRGCTDVTYVDKFFPCIQFVQKTAETLKIQSDIRIFRSDVFKFMETNGEDYDYIFAGPPYALTTMDTIPDLIFAHKLLRPQGWFVMEHNPNHNYTKHPFYFQERHYGKTIFSFFQLPPDDAENTVPSSEVEWISKKDWIMKYCFILFALILHFGLAAQNDFSGKWVGYLTQEKGGFREKYYCTMVLEQNGKKVTGYSYVSVEDIHAEMELSGDISGNTLKFKEFRLVQYSKLDNMVWCLKWGNVQLKKKDSEWTLEGSWDGKSLYGPCIPGKVFLKREVPKA